MDTHCACHVIKSKGAGVPFAHSTEIIKMATSFQGPLLQSFALLCAVEGSLFCTASSTEANCNFLVRSETIDEVVVAKANLPWGARLCKVALLCVVEGRQVVLVLDARVNLDVDEAAATRWRARGGGLAPLQSLQGLNPGQITRLRERERDL